RPAHGALDLVETEGLAQVVIGTAPDRLDRRVHRGERGEDQHGRRWLAREQSLEDGEPVDLWHAEIDERHVEELVLGERDRLGAAAGGAHAIALALEHLDQQVAGDGVIVGDENGGAMGAHTATRSTGRITRKTLPRPGSLTTSMRPPWSCT